MGLKMVDSNKLYNVYKEQYCKTCPSHYGMPCHDCHVLELAYNLEGMEEEAVPLSYIKEWIKKNSSDCNVVEFMLLDWREDNITNSSP